MTQKVLILKGLPASGKSTFALELVKKERNWKRINKDDLRAMLDGGKWSRGNEKFINDTKISFMCHALQKGLNVIIDDTNFSEDHEKRIRETVSTLSYGPIEVEVKIFDTPLDECIRRDAARPNPVGAGIIKDMWKRYLKPAAVIPPEHNSDLLDAYIFDIDGTLAKNTTRGFYDWSRVGEDSPNEPVALLCRILSQHCKIVVVSGRDSVCRQQTTDWLIKHQIPYNELYMRPEGDMRKDCIVKKELYENHIKDRFNVLAIFDDRTQVVKMWREELGLTVCQVDKGDF